MKSSNGFNMEQLRTDNGCPLSIFKPFSIHTWINDGQVFEYENIFYITQNVIITTTLTIQDKNYHYQKKEENSMSQNYIILFEHAYCPLVAN